MTATATAGVQSGPEDKTSRFLEARLIDWPKVDGSIRSFSKEKAQGLSQSIKCDGLIHPIAVRPNPDAPGRYVGIVGKHRWYASHKLLKYDLIEARVVEATDAQAELMRDAENLFRSALKPAQAVQAMKRWNDAYDVQWKQYQAEVEDRKAKKAAARAALGHQDAPAEVQSGPVDPDAPPVTADYQPDAVAEEPEPVPPPANFARDVAAKTGKSETAVKRINKIAKAFNEEQLEVFEQMGVPQTWMETIAKIASVAHRDQVVALVASGKDVESAIGEVMGVTEIKRTDGLTKQVGGSEKELSDDEWVDQSCGEILAILPHKASFRANAILYRQTTDLRATFKSKAKGAMADAKKAGANAGLWGLINRLVSLSHPKHWLKCGQCFGNGVVAGEVECCKKCFGAGFVTTSEK